MNKFYFYKNSKNKLLRKEILSAIFCPENTFSVNYKSGAKEVMTKVLGTGLILLGVINLLYFVLPVLFMDFYYKYVFASTVVSPVPSVLLNNKPSNELASTSPVGLTDAKKWYPGYFLDANNNKIVSYTLSIPKLRVKDVSVTNKDYDLSKHLVQYLGTSSPGEKGTAVVFGHSSLPQLYNPGNYLSVFSMLHTLEKGDNIKIDVNGLVYNYSVYSVSVTDADDTSMLNNVSDNSYLTLVTCFPPGTVWRRLVVRAKLT